MAFGSDAPRCFFLPFHSADVVFLIKKQEGTARHGTVRYPSPTRYAPTSLSLHISVIFTVLVSVSGHEQPMWTGHSSISLVGLIGELASS